MRSGLDINITHLDFAGENLKSLNLRYYFETKNQIMFICLNLKLKVFIIYYKIFYLYLILIYVYSVENITDSLRNINVLTEKVVFYNILYCIFFYIYFIDQQ